MTDAGIGYLSELTQLRYLRIVAPAARPGVAGPITNESIVHLIRLTGLVVLCLGNTQITDAGLAEIKTLSNLRVLELPGNMKITEKGISRLREALPGLFVNRGRGAQPQGHHFAQRAV